MSEQGPSFDPDRTAEAKSEAAFSMQEGQSAPVPPADLSEIPTPPAPPQNPADARAEEKSEEAWNKQPENLPAAPEEREAA
jgi:hypothetical protein